MTKNGDVDDEAFVASTGWLQKFMKRNGLSLRRKTSVAQKDQEKLLRKLCHIYCILGGLCINIIIHLLL